MITKGLVMIKDDKKIATFHSTLKNGDYIQVGDMLTDAIELADTVLLKRD